MRRFGSDHLADRGMAVAIAANGAEALMLLNGETGFELVLLDIRLGVENGLDLLDDLRSRCDLPVIITTGHRRDEIDRVLRLGLGADDSVIKPFRLRELNARMRLILRRTGGSAVAPVQSQLADFAGERSEGWFLNLRQRRLTDPGGGPLEQPKTGYFLLTTFLHAPRRLLSCRQFLQATRIHKFVVDRSIEFQNLRLRCRIEYDPNKARLIVTERGVGCALAAFVDGLVH